MTTPHTETMEDRYKKTIVSRAVEISPHGVLVLYDFMKSEISLALKEKGEEVVKEIEGVASLLGGKNGELTDGEIAEERAFEVAIAIIKKVMSLK